MYTAGRFYPILGDVGICNNNVFQTSLTNFHIQVWV